MNNAYFGKKGYTIYKDDISVDEHHNIRNDLTVSPFIPKTSFNNNISFPIYRESNNKFYFALGYKILMILGDFAIS